VRRFSIRFDGWYGVLSSVLLLPPSAAYVELEPDTVSVRMGWAFRARFPRADVASATEMAERPLSRGVHGFAGRWLVNGSADGLVRLGLEPVARGYVMGFPVRLRELMVSVADPSGLIDALRRSGGSVRRPS